MKLYNKKDFLKLQKCTVYFDKPEIDGKCYGELEVGHFNHATIVGNITNKEDFERYKKAERI